MQEYLGKKYKLKSSDKYDDYLKFIGVGLLSRKAAASVSPEATLTKQDGKFTFSVQSSLKNIVCSFKLGEEFEYERADGTMIKAMCDQEENKLIEIQHDKEGVKTTVIKEFTPEKLTITTTADGWNGVAVRVYEIVK